MNLAPPAGIEAPMKPHLTTPSFHPQRRRVAGLLLVGLAPGGWLPALAQQGQPAQQGEVRLVEGRRFPTRLQLGGSELLLNGTGVRAVAWFKGYAAGLYLRERAGEVAQAVGMAGPKRLQLQLLHDAPAAEFVKALRKGVERNTSAEAMPAIAPGLQRFEELISAVGTVRRHDVVDLDLLPGQGLSFSVNGTLRGEPIAGDELYAALLRAFLGERPYDRRLKAGLLGQPGTPG